MNSTMIRVLLCGAAALPMLPIGRTSAAAQSENQNVMVTGMVSCRECRNMHPAKGWTNSSCTRMCVRAGSDFVLVVGQQIYRNKVYKLDGNTKVFEKLAGGKATFLGHFEDSGKAFYVDSVMAAK